MKMSRRMQNLPPYHFANAAKRIAERRAVGIDVINLSMGDPDLPTPDEVIDALCEAAHDPINQRYPEYRGMGDLLIAIKRWFQARFMVGLAPETEILPLIGSKEGLAHLPLALLDPGDVALVPDPYYPVYRSSVALAEAEAYLIPLDPQAGYLPDLESIPPDVLRRAKMLWLNYPNNPTGACAPADFFHHAVRFAREHDILLVHDMAYSEISYDGYRPMSLLEIPGAKDVAVEFHSFSKSFNMAGFRLGFLAGNATIVDALGQLKSNIDTGIFRPIQRAAIRALSLSREWIAERNAIYQRRRDLVVATCNTVGMKAATPKAGLYVWAAVPPGRTAAEFAMWLLDEVGVFVTPGTNFGAGGEGFVRISLTVPDKRLEEAMARLERAV
jgi:LL-diaminopimelate aminotransferase